MPVNTTIELLFLEKLLLRVPDDDHPVLRNIARRLSAENDEIRSLVVSLKADTKKFEKDMQNAAKRTREAGRVMRSVATPAERYRHEIDKLDILLKKSAHVRGCTYHSQCRDLRLMVLTHNVMILLWMRVFYRAFLTPFHGFSGSERRTWI